MRQVPVWDLSVRIFHWALVVLVIACIATGGEHGTTFVVHAYAGYLVLLLLLFRVGWGFAGSRRALFSDFLYSWTATSRYAATVLKFKPERHIGHNPLGGWMVALMIAVLAGGTVTGVMMMAMGSKALGDVHETLGNVMQILVAVHILGVLVDWALTRENLVRGMFTGTKAMTDEAAAREPPTAPTWRAIVLAVAVAAFGLVLFQQIDYGVQVAAFDQKEVARRAAKVHD